MPIFSTHQCCSPLPLHPLNLYEPHPPSRTHSFPDPRSSVPPHCFQNPNFILLSCRRLSTCREWGPTEPGAGLHLWVNLLGPQPTPTSLKVHTQHSKTGMWSVVGVAGRENQISPWWFSKHFETLVSTLSIWLIRICSVWKATKRSQRSLDRCWQQHPHLLTSSGMTCHPPDLRYRLRTTESVLWTEEKEKNWGKRAKHICNWPWYLKALPTEGCLLQRYAWF